jgi:hypothetical protein
MFTFTVKIAGTFVVLVAEPAAAIATTAAHTLKMTLALTASKVAGFFATASATRRAFVSLAGQQ